MAVPAGKVPIIQSALAALTGWRDGVGPALPYAAAAAGIAGIIAVGLGPGAAGGGPFGGLAIQLAMTVPAVLFYTAALRHALRGSTGSRLEMAAAMGRVFSAMAVVGFFLFIVFVVALIPGALMLGMVLEPYLPQFEAAQNDPAAVMALMERIGLENAAAFAVFVAVFGFIWMALTSRLYLSAAASVAGPRVRTFETWRWTDGNMLRIMAARLLLLVPAWIVMSLLVGLLGGLLGVTGSDPTAIAELAVGTPILFGALQGATAFVQFLIYAALEARLCAYLYQGLKPATEETA